MPQCHLCNGCKLVQATCQKLYLWKRKLFGLSALAVVFIYISSHFHTKSAVNLGQDLAPKLLPRQENSSQVDNTLRTSEQADEYKVTAGPHEDNKSTSGQSSKEPDSKYFNKVRGVEHYVYSAIVNLDSNIQNTNVSKYNLKIVVTSLDATNEKYKCCIVFKDVPTPVVTPATVHYNTGQATGVYISRQYSCTVLNSSSLPQKVALTTSSVCPKDPRDYVTILYPPRHPGGIALCGKISHGRGLDPEKVIEWFEIQRLLGVDKILIFDLETSENVSRVFKYYQELGLLDLQPYELPGLPKNRSLAEKFKHEAQFNHDETMPVLECRQRMGGYDYVISHDLDEMIIPRKHVTLKTLLQDHVTKYPQAAAFFFPTEFFITTWPPTNPEEDLMVKRYRMTRVVRWECWKYVYVTSRVLASTTHAVQPVSGQYNSQRLQADVAILHHYRQCPEDTWKTCDVERNTDDIMTRYTDLDERVLKVRHDTRTQPSWTPVRRATTTESVSVKH